jgi:hypothetical protein
MEMNSKVRKLHPLVNSILEERAERLKTVQPGERDWKVMAGIEPSEKEQKENELKMANQTQTGTKTQSASQTAPKTYRI